MMTADQAADLASDGADPYVCDLEAADPGEIAKAIDAADAVVFAAGAGPGSGAGRKWSMDRDGAIKLVDAARSVGVARYVIVSSIGAESPPEGDDVFSIYLRAKAEADEAVMASDRDWTVVRPGRRLHLSLSRTASGRTTSSTVRWVGSCSTRGRPAHRLERRSIW